MEYRYALKGTNDDETACSVCGKQELSRVMWLVKLDADGSEGEAFPVGTTCGAKMLRSTKGKVVTKMNNFEVYVRRQRDSLKYGHPAMKEYYKLLEENTGCDWKYRLESGLLAKLRELENQASEWAAAQPIKPMELSF